MNARVVVVVVAVALLAGCAMGFLAGRGTRPANGSGKDAHDGQAGRASDDERARLPVGPYKTVQLLNGATAPWYVLPFDKNGVAEAPLTQANLIGAIKANNYTDVFLFSHGWNNDWATANARYDEWLNGFLQMRAAKDLK